MAKKKPKRSNTELEAGDYVLADKSGWFGIDRLVVHIFVPYKSKQVAVEIFPVDCTMDDEDVLAECRADQPAPKKRKKS